MSSIPEIKSVHYPESDGKPMGETDLHRDAMVRHIELLKHHFRGQDVYVSGDLLVYYEQGNPKKFIVPDAFIVKGVRPHQRRIFKIWVERAVPNLVIETTSNKTKRKDSTTKPELYKKLGVHEYFLFDPTEDYLDPPLQGFRLVDGEHVPISRDEKNGLFSEELGLRLLFENGELIFEDPATGERLQTGEERAEVESAARQREEQARRRAEQARRREEQARQREEQARRAAEAEVARLNEELRRLKGE